MNFPNGQKKLNNTSWFLPVDNEECQRRFAEIAKWIQQHSKYKQTAKDAFLDGADSLIIAKAKSMDITVVTQEKSSPESKATIFIPDVCLALGVGCLNLLQLFRALKAKF